MDSYMYGPQYGEPTSYVMLYDLLPGAVHTYLPFHRRKTGISQIKI